MADEDAKTPEPIKRWAYPFKKKGDPNAKDSKAAEVDDPKTYYEALATAEDGFYPVGANGLWHGGIHFGAQTGNVLSQDEGVRCIADGEVIAYRIDSAYPKVKYECGEATYSRGFVLVKHRLQLPPAPKKAAAGAKTDDKAATPAKTDSKAAEEPALTFFSLYMHLLDWAGFEAKKELARPAFWADSTKFVVGKKAVDADPYTQPAPAGKGINVRQTGKGSDRIGWLPPGTVLTVEAGSGSWRKLASINSGQMSADPQNTAAADAPLGWIYIKELDPAPSKPETKDAVAVMDTPVPIKAGELIGYLGQYQRYVDASALACKDRPLAHVEVFSGEDVQGFIDKSKARGKELDAKQKTLLVVDKGSSLVLPANADQSIAAGVDVQLSDDSPKAGRWAKVQSLTATPAPTKKNPKAVKLTPTGDAMWVERALLNDKGQRASTAVTLAAWSGFPLQAANATGPTANYLRVAAIKTLKTTAADDKGIRWWEIDVDTPDAKGNTLGWACETGHLQSPWEWPGFEIVSETAMLVDQHGKQIIDERLDTPTDKDDFKAKAERAKEGALFQKLYDLIDVDKNESLTTNELRAALKKPWLAQTISRVIARYESEWGGDMSKWNALDTHMAEKADTDWKTEKGRIQSLQIWGDVKGKHGFPDDSKVAHLHSIGLIGNFLTESIDCITFRILSKTGSIEKITPSQISPGKEKKVKYIYVDATETSHDIGEYEFITASRVLSGNTPTSGTSDLVDLRTLENYSSGNVKYGFYYDTRLTTRPYIAILPLASLIGAMLDVGYEDISCNGFSDDHGHSVGGSKSHINGQNGDIKFLRLDKLMQTEGSLDISATPELLDEIRQNTLNDALYKYGWKSMLAWEYKINGKSKLLNHTKHYANHNHHLHVQGYNSDVIDIKL